MKKANVVLCRFDRDRGKTPEWVLKADKEGPPEDLDLVGSERGYHCEFCGADLDYGKEISYKNRIYCESCFDERKCKYPQTRLYDGHTKHLPSPALCACCLILELMDRLKE